MTDELQRVSDVELRQLDNADLAQLLIVCAFGRFPNDVALAKACRDELKRRSSPNEDATWE